MLPSSIVNLAYVAEACRRYTMATGCFKIEARDIPFAFLNSDIGFFIFLLFHFQIFILTLSLFIGDIHFHTSIFFKYFVFLIFPNYFSLYPFIFLNFHFLIFFLIFYLLDLKFFENKYFSNIYFITYTMQSSKFNIVRITKLKIYTYTKFR